MLKTIEYIPYGARAMTAPGSINPAAVLYFYRAPGGAAIRAHTRVAIAGGGLQAHGEIAVPYEPGDFARLLGLQFVVLNRFDEKTNSASFDPLVYVVPSWVGFVKFSGDHYTLQLADGSMLHVLDASPLPVEPTGFMGL